MSNDFDSQLSGQLRSHANTLPMPDTEVSLILTAGARRQTRHRRTTMLSTLAAVGALTIGTVVILNQQSADKIIISGRTPGEANSTEDNGGLPEVIPEVDTTVMLPVLTTSTFGQTGGPPAEPITPVAPTLQWSRADVAPGDALGTLAYGTSVIGDGPFYAVSTAPGRSWIDGVPTPVIYRSDDALHWAATGSPAHTIGAVAASDGALYAVGTAALVAQPSPYGPFGGVVSRSIDGGATWSPTPLSIDPTDLAREPGVLGIHSMLSVAAGPRGVVVAAVNRAVLDVPTLLPGVDTTYGYSLTPDGIDVMGPPVAGPCDGSTPIVLQSASGDECYISEGPVTPYTWDQIGISTKIRDSIEDPVAFWFSPDGITFAPVDAPTPPTPGSSGATYISVLVSTDVGFVAQVSTRGIIDVGTMLLTSPDGLMWSEATPIPIDDPSAVGSINGRLVASGINNVQQSAGPERCCSYVSRSAVATSADMGLTWQTVDLQGITAADDGPGANIDVRTAGIGSHGITIAGTIAIDVTQRPGGLSLSKNGITAVFRSRYPLLPDFIDESTGQPIDLAGGSGGLAYWDDTNDLLGDIVLENEDGSERLRITLDEHSQLFDDARSAYGGDILRTIVIHSSDGVHWSREWWSDVAGVPDGRGGPEHIASVGDRIIVSAVEPTNVAVDQSDTSRPLPKRIVAVGVPKG